MRKEKRKLLNRFLRIQMKMPKTIKQNSKTYNRKQI